MPTIGKFLNVVIEKAAVVKAFFRCAESDIIPCDPGGSMVFTRLKITGWFLE